MATNYEKRFEAIDENEVYTLVENVRQYGATYTFHRPVKVVEKAVPIAGVSQLVGVRVQRTDTGEQFDTHVKHITRPWAEFIDLEVDRDQILETVTANAQQLRSTEVPATWRATLAANHLDDSGFVEDGDELYVLVEYTTTRKTSRKKGHDQEERITSVTLMAEDGTVRELKKRADFKHLVGNSSGGSYEHVKSVSKAVFAQEVDVETLTDEVLDKLRNGEASLSHGHRSPGKTVGELAQESVKAALAKN